MDTCDVLIVGGGPAGSTCAWKLRQAGADVLVMDRAVFPRDKVCAGWITPQVVQTLRLDLDEYRSRRTLQPITGFRSGLIGGAGDLTTTYDHPVSYGIRRCEFDHYLLGRSRARLNLGDGVSTIRREQEGWVVNGRIRTNMLVGAGGHFCPVARLLNPANGESPEPHMSNPAKAGSRGLHAQEWPVVVAQEAEFLIEPGSAGAFAVAPETPELYFSADLRGYGWCFRKQDYLNIGLGLLDRRACSAATRAFVAYLQARGRVPATASWRWRGHAYLLGQPRARHVRGDAVLLLGDAAGLAYPQSGEGIRPAIESGLIAALTILDAEGVYTRERLAPYEQQLSSRLGFSSQNHTPRLPSAVAAKLAAGLMRVPPFVRHVVLDRWFLRSAEPSLTLA
jgi:flavin-dependent dehydrogenase